MPQEKTTVECVEQEEIADRSFQSMNFVQSISEEDEQLEGNKKTGASAGCLEEIKGGSRLSRYATEATAEHVGRSARKMGMKSVVMKEKGSTYFRKKKAVILSCREGYTLSECKRSEGVGQPSNIMYIHDVTQLPHNGCRHPKKCRK
ncbi:unnamed protein product [Victoria cruziana]